MTLVLTIVRHGNTFEPDEPSRRIGSLTDLPLVASGEEQARALGRALARDGEAFDRVLASPLRRTQRTAELIMQEMKVGLPVEPCAWLAEIDHGPDENQPEDRVLARIGADALARWNDALVVPPGWSADAPSRLAAWRTLLATASGRLLLVTSAGSARFGLRAASLAPAGLRTGAWGRLLVEDGRIKLAAWDCRPESTADDA